MKKLAVMAAIIAAGSAQAMPELKKATPLEMAEFDTIIAAIEAETYREKVSICTRPEWAYRAFILKCLDEAENSFIVYPQPAKKE